MSVLREDVSESSIEVVKGRDDWWGWVGRQEVVQLGFNSGDEFGDNLRSQLYEWDTDTVRGDTRREIAK